MILKTFHLLNPALYWALKQWIFTAGYIFPEDLVVVVKDTVVLLVRELSPRTFKQSGNFYLGDKSKLIDLCTIYCCTNFCSTWECFYPRSSLSYYRSSLQPVSTNSDSNPDIYRKPKFIAKFPRFGNLCLQTSCRVALLIYIVLIQRAFRSDPHKI